MPTSRPPLSPEVRARLRELILQRQPWRSSTGPRTPEGKARTRWNAWRHGFYSARSIEARRSLRRLEATS